MDNELPFDLSTLPDHERTAFIERVKREGTEAAQAEVISVILYYMDLSKAKVSEKISTRRSGSSTKRKDQIIVGELDF